MLRFPPSGARRFCDPRRFRDRGPTVLVMAVLFGLVGAGCGGGDDSGDRPRATLPVSEEVNSTESDDADAAEVEVQPAELGVEEAVEAAYLEANRVFFSLMEDPEQDLAELEATRTGEALEFITGLVEARRSSGERSTYPTGFPQAEVLKIEIEDDEATLLACETNDAILRDSEGKTLNDETATRTYEARLVRRQDRWIVADEFELSREEGDVPCDV